MRNTDDLALFTLDPGQYTQIRIHVLPDNEIEIEEHGRSVVLPLKIPSGEETGIKLKGPFTIPTAGTYSMLVDFDAEKSVHCSHKKCILKPVIKIIEPRIAGITRPPTITIPAGLPPEIFSVTQSDLVVPDRIGTHFVPVSPAYEIGLDFATLQQADPTFPGSGSVIFPGAKAEVRIAYSRAELQKRGLSEEFVLWYFDSISGTWKSADGTLVDSVNQVVIGTVSHMTPYVLTALPLDPLNTTNVTDPPACLAADAGTINLGSSVPAWTPRFTVLDSYFKYYQDRTYFFDDPAQIQELGFDQALGIAPCNGASSCGGTANHKQYTGADYIHFNAHTDIDVYVMYDTREGIQYGTGIADYSKDAPWLANPVNGWTALAGQYVHTTDAVGFYRIYKKSFNKGDFVQLNGNRQGVTTPVGSGVDTNYWVLIKRRGVTGSSPAASLCEAQKDPGLHNPVSNLNAAPGITQAIVSWQNPNDLDFAGTVIRRGPTAPISPADGTAPGGAKASDQSWVDAGLAPATTYCYSVFAVNVNNAYSSPRSVCVTTAAAGQDADGDGLSDSYEAATDYSISFPGGASPRYTSGTNADTDGDGIADGVEVAQGTDPTNGDTIAPAVTAFTLTSPTPTTSPVIAFTVSGTDNVGVTGWMVTQNSTRPLAGDTRWLAASPTSITLVTQGTYGLYAWVKDAAGNVSAAFAPVALDLQGIKVPKWVFAERIDSVSGRPLTWDTYEIDPSSGMVTLRGQSAPRGTVGRAAFDATGQYLLTTEEGYGGTGEYIVVYRSDPLTGSLTLTNSQSFGNGWVVGLASHPRLPLVYVADQSGNIAVFLLDMPTGTLAPIQSILAPSGISQALAIDHSGRYLYSGGGSHIDCFAIGTTGTLVFVGSYPIPANFGLAFHPFLPILYTTGYPAGPSINLVDPVTGALQNVFLRSVDSFALGVDPRGEFLFNASAFGGLELMRLDANGRISASVPTVVDPGSIFGFGIDDTGTFFSSGDWTLLRIYRINRQVPAILQLVSAVPNVVLGVFHSIHDANDPPVVNPGTDRWVQLASGSITLNGIGSFDPDAGRCTANAANYQYAWTFTSVPAGSALTNASIVNPTALTTARFTPDVPGDYKVHLTFKDDPGTCNATAKTAGADVTIKVGYEHTLATRCSSSLCRLAPYPPVNPGLPADAVFVEDWSQHQVVDVGIYKGFWVIPGPGSWLPFPICDFGSIVTLEEGRGRCAGRVGDIPYLEVWSATDRQVQWAGTWHWFTYVP